jgi:hypothetical protein
MVNRMKCLLQICCPFYSAPPIYISPVIPYNSRHGPSVILIPTDHPVTRVLGFLFHWPTHRPTWLASACNFEFELPASTVLTLPPPEAAACPQVGAHGKCYLSDSKSSQVANSGGVADHWTNTWTTEHNRLETTLRCNTFSGTWSSGKSPGSTTDTTALLLTTFFNNDTWKTGCKDEEEGNSNL